MGQAHVILPGDTEIPETPIPASKVSMEIEMLEQAVNETIAEMKELRDSANKKMGAPVAKIFEAQLLIASDNEFLNQVKKAIKKQRRTAGFIFNDLIKKTTLPLKRSSETYMHQTAADIEAVGDRIISHLTGYDKCDLKFQPNTILVAKRFSPGEVLSYRQRKAIGFVVSEGGRNSHMGLISRGLMLPVILYKEAHLSIPDHCRVILDGLKGDIIINPTDDEWSEYQRLKKKQGSVSITRIKRLTEIPPKTADGVTVNVGVNLTLPGPVDEILSAQKFPVGLYRTEFLYLNANRFPSEDEQFAYYSEIADQYKKTTVTLRTFDLGYDKLNKNDFWIYEENPALGWRGIRPMLELTKIFKTQIRAILRASTRRNIKIMLPMISDVSEIDKAKRLIQQVKFDLKRNKIDFDPDIEIGIMVEVPSAALTVDQMAKKVDFISIGTNDLTQYTLAADRMNQKVANIYSAFHPSVLRLICNTVESCKKHKIPVSICGEIAGDLLALPLFIGMGIDMLSMNPGKIFDFCRMVKKIDSTLARILTESILRGSTKKEILTKLQHYKSELEKNSKVKRK